MEKTVQEIIEMSKSIETIQRVNAESLLYEFGEYEYDFDIDYGDFDKRITSKYFDSWVCWDTPVGKYLVHFDDVPVAITVQSARKAEIEWFWLGKDCAKSVEDYMMAFKKQEDNRYYICIGTVVPLEGDKISNTRSAIQ